MVNQGWFKVGVEPPDPDSRVVAIAEMKAHLRIDDSDDDDLIDFFLSEAVDAVESDCRIALLPRESELYLEHFPPIGNVSDGMLEYFVRTNDRTSFSF